MNDLVKGLGILVLSLALMVGFTLFVQGKGLFWIENKKMNTWIML